MFKFKTENQKNEFISFMIDDDAYCLNIQYVNEIIFIPPISKIPNVPDYVEGAINLRGKIVQIINFRQWLQLPWATYTNNSRIIILNINDHIFGILVDSINEVFKLKETEQQIVPKVVLEKLSKPYLSNIIFHNENIVLEINPTAIKI